MGSRKVEWLNLPRDLWTEIAKRLPQKMDHLRFRSVCSIWRSFAPPFHKIPLPCLPIFPSVDPGAPRVPTCFVERTVYLVQIPEDLWNLPTMNGFKRSFLIKVVTGDKLRLESLLSNTSINLNKAKRSQSADNSVLNLWNLRVTELCKAFHPQGQSEMECFLSKGEGEQFAAMAIHYYDPIQIYYYRAGEKEWKSMAGKNMENDWHDIIEFQGQFCAVDIEGQTLLFDSSLAATRISPPMMEHDYENGPYTKKRLVESCGELFMVEICDEDAKVFRLNLKEKAWVLVESLGDRIFFIAKDCSFSVCAKEFPGCKGNCVYLEFHNDYKGDEYTFCGRQTAVYDLETGKFGELTSFPEHINIFWPPPKWLEQPTLLTLALLRTLM